MFVPPEEVYEIKPEDPQARLNRTGYGLPPVHKLTQSSGGEILAHHMGSPVPRKGLIWNEGVMANVLVKRTTMLFFLPFADILKGPIKFLESYLQHYTRFVDSIYLGCEHVPYLKKQYYSNSAKGMWELTRYFLEALGIDEKLANQTGKIVATILENDDAYRIPITDILSSFHPREIIRNFPQFFEDAVILFCERSDNGEYKGKVKKVVKLLKYVFWLPKFKKALRVAFMKVDYNNFGIDIYDYYWTLSRQGYDFGGRSLKHRRAEWKHLTEDFRTYYDVQLNRELVRLQAQEAQEAQAQIMESEKQT